MSKMIKINVVMEGSTRANEGVTRAVLVARYDIESLWQSSTKDVCTVRLSFDRVSNSLSNSACVEELKVTDAEFERLSAILTAADKEA